MDLSGMGWDGGDAMGPEPITTYQGSVNRGGERTGKPAQHHLTVANPFQDQQPLSHPDKATEVLPCHCV